MENPAAETVRTIESLDEEQYTNFVEERLERCTKPVTDKLSNNTLALFSRSQTKTQSKQQMQLTAVKSACSLFLRLYIECQSRNGDLQSKSTTLPDIRPNLMPQSLTEQPLSKCCSDKDLHEYVNIVFAPYIYTQLEKKVHRLDLVWDVYLPDSLKGTTRQKSGSLSSCLRIARTSYLLIKTKLR